MDCEDVTRKGKKGWISGASPPLTTWVVSTSKSSRFNVYIHAAIIPHLLLEFSVSYSGTQVGRFNLERKTKDRGTGNMSEIQTTNVLQPCCYLCDDHRKMNPVIGPLMTVSACSSLVTLQNELFGIVIIHTHIGHVKLPM